MYSFLKKHKFISLSIFLTIIFSGNFYLEQKSIEKKPYECNDYPDLFESGYKKINNKNYYIVFCGIYSPEYGMSEEFRILVFTEDKKKLLTKRYFIMSWGGRPGPVFWEKNQLLYFDKDNQHDVHIINFPPTWWDWFRANYL